MSIINKVLGVFLGNKYERDMKEIMPYVEKTKIEYEKLSSLSNDELREITHKLRKRIPEGIREEENEIAGIRAKAEAEKDVYVKEELFSEIDKIEERISEKLEDILT